MEIQIANDTTEVFDRPVPPAGSKPGINVDDQDEYDTPEFTQKLLEHFRRARNAAILERRETSR